MDMRSKQFVHRDKKRSVAETVAGSWWSANGAQLLLCVAAAAAALCVCSSRKTLVYRGDGAQVLTREGKPTAICLPLQTITTEYYDNTATTPDTQFSDSFLIEAANALLFFEVGKEFELGGVPSGPVQPQRLYSVLAADTQDLAGTAAFIQSVAESAGTEIVVVPYRCSVRYNVFKPAGWRNDKYENTYARPVSYRAFTQVHLQYWSAEGTLLYERVGKSDTGKPIFYSWFKREEPRDDVVRFARRFYAPPIMRSLLKSVRLALVLR